MTGCGSRFAAAVYLVAVLAACDEQARTNPLPTMRLGAASISAGDGSRPALTDRDTTTSVPLAAPLELDVRLRRAAEVRRVKAFGAGVRIHADGAPDLVLDASAGEFWAALDVPPSTTDHVRLKVTPVAPGARIAEVELWGAGMPPAPRDPRVLAAATRSEGTAYENAIVLPATPAASTLRPGSVGPACLEAELPSFDPRAARRAYLVYESTARRAVVLSRSLDGQPASGGFWLPPAPEPRTLVDELDPERLGGTSDKVSLCLPDDATGDVTVGGLRLVLVLDDGSDVFSREAHARWGQALDGQRDTALAVDAPMEIALDRPVEIERAELHLGAAPARLAESSAFDGRSWTVGVGLELPEMTGPFPIPARAPHALRLTFSGLRRDAPAALVSDVDLTGSGIGPRVGVPRIVVTSPALQVRNGVELGERFGDRAYLSGWAESPAGPGAVEIEGASVGLGGAFGVALDRPAGAERWAVTLTARFPDGTSVTRTLHLDVDASTEVGDGSASVGTRSSSDGRFGREDQVSWGSADAEGGGRIALGTDVEIEIPPGAVSRKTGIGIERKGPEVMPRLDAGMVNVTAPAHGAYRFHPRGQSFAKAVKLRIPYDEALLPEGLTPDAIRTYYFDEGLGEWRALPRAEVLRASSQIVSETTHFTFMINAVLVAPDHPGPSSFDPNAIGGLESASPAAGMHLIEAPAGNNQGTAQLAFPIRLPRARGAFQPELHLAYDSGGGNGWVGVGWNLPVSSVELDTRFGVPAYGGQERYLLDGAQLVPTSATSPCQDGRSGAVYRARVEREFRRIVRCGDSPTAYWFEVSDKAGVLSVYGHGEGARLRSYEAARSIGQWNLERVVDTNGNLTEYLYDRDDRSQPTVASGGWPLVRHGEDFRQLYLASIQYTGRAAREGAGALAGGTPGPYRVVVESERDGAGRILERPDSVISGRLGFKVVTRRRLHAIRVELDDGAATRRIREVRLVHEQGSFGKSRLKRIDVYGAGDAPALFYSHTLAYTDADPVPFDAPVAWTFDSRDREPLTRSEETGVGTHGYVGISSSMYRGGFSAGFRNGFNVKESRTTSLLADVNGDGLPDRACARFDAAPTIAFNSLAKRTLTRMLPDGDPGAGTSLESIDLSTLGATEGAGWNAAFQAGYGIGSADVGYSYFFDRTTELLADFDGDGLVDVVSPDGVLLQQPRTASAPEFRFAPGKVLEGPSGQPAENPNLTNNLQNELRPSDVLLEWTAPFDGNVDVVGTLAFPAFSTVDPGWDGVRLRVYRADAYGPSVTQQVGADLDLRIGTSPASVLFNRTGVEVSRGTRLYFVISTLARTPVDPAGPSPIEALRFAPNIAYTALGNCTWGLCEPLAEEKQGYADPTGAGVYVFDAAHDFKLAGTPLAAVVVPATGRLSLSSALTKVASSDDVRACIQRFPADAVVADVPCAAPGPFTLLGRGMASYEPEAVGTYRWDEDVQVQAGDKLLFRIESDLPIDPASVRWTIAGKMAEVCEGADGCRAPQPEEVGPLSFAAEPYFALHLPLDPAADPDDPGTWNPDPRPLVPLVVPEDGTLEIHTSPPNLLYASYTEPVWLTARSASGSFFKELVDAPGRLVTVPVTRGELVYFQIHSGAQFSGITWSPAVTFTAAGAFSTPVEYYAPVNATFNRRIGRQGHAIGVRAVLGGGFHGWRYGAWHGANDQPFDASLFDLSAAGFEGTDEQRADAVRYGALGSAIRVVEPLLPRHEGTYLNPARTGLLPHVPAYVSRDGTTFVTATAVHAARQGAFVQRQDGRVTTVEAIFAAGRAARAGEGEAVSAGAHVGPANLSIGNGTSRQTTDLVDLNGDRVLDTAGDDGVRLTDIHSLARHPSSGPVELRKSSDFTVSVGLGISAPIRKIGSGGVVQAVTGMYTSAGGGAGINLSSTDRELMDLNGDGLPDQVRRVAGGSACPGGLFVRLNLGGRFAGEEDCVPVSAWRDRNLDLLADKVPVPGEVATPDKVRRTSAISVQANAGGGGGDREVFAGTVAWESSIAATAVAMLDVNGDGLPDYVRKSSKDARFAVQINQGYAFAPEQSWNGIAPWPANVTRPWLKAGVPDGGLLDAVLASTGTVDAAEASGTYSELPTIGFAFTISFPLTMYGSPAMNFTMGGDVMPRRVSGFELGFEDMDGDGLADHVLKAYRGEGSNEQVWVRLNRQSKANLLVHVDRPLGGSIELDYVRIGNTYDLPESRWVLTSVIERDGRGGSGPAEVVDGHDLRSTFSYAGGRYDRAEREFLGFTSVVRSDVDRAGSTQRRIVQRWRNESFAVKGLLEREELWDASQRLFSVTQNLYRTSPVTVTWTQGCEDETPFFLSAAGYCRSFFTALEREEKRFYEGQGAAGTVPQRPGLVVTQTYGYDQYGNVADFADLGDASDAVVEDDLFATIAYATDADALRLHFVGTPVSVEARDSARTVIRKRAGEYDGRGNLRKLTSWASASSRVDSLFSWTPEGNLLEVQGPDVDGRRYTVDYGYDEPTRTYVTWDPLESTCRHASLSIL